MPTYTVTTASDARNAPGLSLREALALANANPGADTITFADTAAGQTIKLQQGQLTIASDVTIDGGDQGIGIDGQGESRVLNITGAGSDVTLDGLQISFGSSVSSGGGILAGVGTTLTLLGTAVFDNVANGGGGISASGPLELRDSAVTDNVSGGAGGGIHGTNVITLINSTVGRNHAEIGGGGGIYAPSVKLTNSTVAGNIADNHGAVGGGIAAVGDGQVQLTDSTLTGNYANVDGGGVFADSILITNTIVVGNTSGSSRDITGVGLIMSNGHNLFGSDVDGSTPGDLENVNARSVFASTARIAGTYVLGGVLADNGGPTVFGDPTETVALLDASTNPALGRGAGSASITTDQRGEPRPAVNPDIGAFELEQSHATAVGTAGVKLLQGSSDSEALLGLAQAEVLHGGRGSDLLDGGKGADRLRGGPGSDALIGGGASDRFIFAEASHSAPATPDAILDFSQRQGDRIVLRGLDGDLDQPGDQPLEFIGRHRFTDAGQVMEQVIDGHTVVRVNLDDDPRAELIIQFHDAIDLHRADFVL